MGVRNIKRKYNVLVTPAGSGMAIAAIKLLKKDEKIRIISADADKLAPGLYLSDKGYIVPEFGEPSFFSKIEKIIKYEEIDVIIPALDPILLDFSKQKKKIEEKGTKVVVYERKTIEITRDKWTTYRKLLDLVPIPKSFRTIEDINIDFPLIIKPRDGSGSKNVYKLDNKKEIDFFYKRVTNPIIQEYLPGKEYTVDCLADLSGKLLFCIQRERLETKAGISVKGKVINNKELEKMAKIITDNICFNGPFFFQAKEDKDGTPKLTEINPRISGTMSLSSSAGPNIHSLTVRMYMGEKITIPEIKYGLHVSRYWEDIYLTDGEIQKTLEDLK